MSNDHPFPAAQARSLPEMGRPPDEHAKPRAVTITPEHAKDRYGDGVSYPDADFPADPMGGAAYELKRVDGRRVGVRGPVRDKEPG